MGYIPEDIAKVTELSILDLEGGRPTDYIGCAGNNFQKSPLPAGFFTLPLTDINLEYTCLGGEWPGRTMCHNMLS